MQKESGFIKSNNQNTLRFIITVDFMSFSNLLLVQQSTWNTWSRITILITTIINGLTFLGE